MWVTWTFCEHQFQDCLWTLVSFCFWIKHRVYKATSSLRDKGIQFPGSTNIFFVLLQTSFPYRAFESLDRYHFVFSVTHKVIFFPFKTHFCWNSTQYSVMTYTEKESKKEWIYICVCVLSYVRLFATLWTVAHQAASSMAFSRQEHWSGIYVYI